MCGWGTVGESADRIQQAESFVGYADEEQPFEGYVALMGMFGIAMSAA